MIKQFFNYAVDRGWKPKTNQSAEDKTTDLVLFDKNNLHFVFSFNEVRDPDYFQLSLPYIDDYDSSNSDQVKLVMSLTRKYKTGKALVYDDNRISLTFEQYVFSDSNIEKLFDIAVGCLETMISEYREWKRSARQQETQS